MREKLLRKKNEWNIGHELSVSNGKDKLEEQIINYLKDRRIFKLLGVPKEK